MIRVRVTGADQAATRLEALRQQIARSSAPVLAQLAPDLVATIQRNIRTQGGGAATWPPLAPSTVATRIRLGFGAEPPLIRTGRLLGGIKVLESGGDLVTVGTEGRRESVLDAVRPFTIPSLSDVERWIGRVVDYHLGEEGA